jgi:hypothetical protein
MGDDFRVTIQALQLKNDWANVPAATLLLLPDVRWGVGNHPLRMVAKILSHGLRRVGHQRRHLHAAGASQQELDGFIVDEAGGRVLVDRAPARLQEDTSECHKTSGIHWLQTSASWGAVCGLGKNSPVAEILLRLPGKWMVIVNNGEAKWDAVNFLFLDTFSLLSLLLLPCSFPVAISRRKPFTPVFTWG